MALSFLALWFVGIPQAKQINLKKKAFQFETHFSARLFRFCIPEFV
jgi:hypothetical protein